MSNVQNNEKKISYLNLSLGHQNFKFLKMDNTYNVLEMSGTRLGYVFNFIIFSLRFRLVYCFNTGYSEDML